MRMSVPIQHSMLVYMMGCYYSGLGFSVMDGVLINGMVC